MVVEDLFRLELGVRLLLLDEENLLSLLNGLEQREGIERIDESYFIDTDARSFRSQLIDS